MEVRDAVEADAGALAALADGPTDVMRNLVHDRSVRVATADEADSGPNADVDEVDRELLGFVSFDAEGRTVHVTQLRGTEDACERLLAEPVRFAAAEGMNVELLAETDNTAVRNAAEATGFTVTGAGPRFAGNETLRYRLDPGSD